VPRALIAAGCLLIVAAAACSNPSGGSATGPTVSSVAVQQADLPSGMVRCPISGKIEDFIKAEQTPDPNTAKSITAYWTDAQSNGAKEAYAAIYADSQDRCAAIKDPQTDVGTATYKLVVNFVLEFKDEATATDAYNNKTIFGFSKSQLKAAPVIEGTKTGLTENSIVLSQAIANQQFYIAEWQNKKFMVILAVLNIDPESSKKVSTAENSRIK
jgi:formylmethanofuran:tetrahydromethanopterin formyltransferase